jgi:hypothetical protein
MQKRTNGSFCSICGGWCRSEEAAAACEKSGVGVPKFAIGEEVRSPFFYGERHFPHGAEDQNRFQVIGESGFVPGTGGESHDRRVRVRMIVKPGQEHIFLESELESAK